MQTNKLNYIEDKYKNKLLGFQYYDDFGFVSIPLHDKAPIIKNWQNTIETIPPTYTTDNTGILTGQINNITVLDIDLKDDGVAYWNELISKNKKINTPYVQTANGGYHYYFKYDKEIENKNRITINNKKIGFDIINNKRQVVAPPSIINGKKYKWIISLEDTNIKKIPKWLKNLLI